MYDHTVPPSTALQKPLNLAAFNRTYTVEGWAQLLDVRVSWWPWSDSFRARALRWNMNAETIAQQIATHQAKPWGLRKWWSTPKDYTLKRAWLTHYQLQQVFTAIQADSSIATAAYEQLKLHATAWLSQLHKSWLTLVNALFSDLGIMEKPALSVSASAKIVAPRDKVKPEESYLIFIRCCAFLGVDKDSEGRDRIASVTLEELRAKQQQLFKHYLSLRIQQDDSYNSKDPTTLYPLIDLPKCQRQLSKNAALLIQLEKLTAIPTRGAHITPEATELARLQGLALYKPLEAFWQVALPFPQLTFPVVGEETKEHSVALPLFEEKATSKPRVKTAVADEPGRPKRRTGKQEPTFEEEWCLFWHNCGILGVNFEVNLDTLRQAYKQDSMDYHWDRNRHGIGEKELLKRLSEAKGVGLACTPTVLKALEIQAQTALAGFVEASKTDATLQQKMVALRQCKHDLFQKSDQAYLDAHAYYKRVLQAQAHTRHSKPELLQQLKERHYKSGELARLNAIDPISIATDNVFIAKIDFEIAKSVRLRIAAEKRSAEQDAETIWLKAELAKLRAAAAASTVQPSHSEAETSTLTRAFTPPPRAAFPAGGSSSTSSPTACVQSSVSAPASAATVEPPHAAPSPV
ncbi:hypothetical protein BH10PSE19_BH10PSE19_13430 [soil metagenome]